MNIRILIFCILSSFTFSKCKNYNKEAAAYYKQKNYIKTIEIANKGLSKKEDKFLYELRGLSYFELKYYEYASHDLNKIITTGSGSLEVLEKANLTNIYLDRNDIAVIQYKELIKHDSLNPSYYFYQGTAYRKLGEYDNAFNCFVRCITLDSSYNSISYNQIGIIYQSLKDFNKAINEFNKSIALDSTNADVYFNRGSSYFSIKKYKNALFDLNKAIQLNPSDSAHILHNRAILYAAIKDKTKCCSDLQQVIRLGYTPINPDLRTYCGNNPLLK